MGQPLYKYMVRGLIDRLLPRPGLATDLPSSARASLTYQAARAEAAYAAPALRRAAGLPGQPVPAGGVRIMEMIEDIPAIGQSAPK